MSLNEKNKLSGEELKKLIVNGKLPNEYINEDNLNVLIDYELEQMGNNEYYDTGIIIYCTDLSVKNYTGKNYLQQKQETFKKIKAQIKAESKNKKPASYTIKRIFAICVLILVIVPTIAFAAFDVNIFTWSRDRFFALIGIEEQQNDTSFLSSGRKEYKTIEEFESVENIDIIIPTWLPDNIKIEIIRYDYNYTEKQIDMKYNDDITVLAIKLNSTIPNMDGTTIYKNNNVIFYLATEANIIAWEYNGNFYNFNCGFDVKEYVEKIIENIK